MMHDEVKRDGEITAIERYAGMRQAEAVLIVYLSCNHLSNDPFHAFLTINDELVVPFRNP
jgi:hypothetical protein